ncbi:histidine phosphatase family protein [Actinobacteria bacterium YIM 96077]|uniref:Histidine phosphatase family protein n=2 Tax=Phytoactinopolyspora halophila TaxID=1981511 RepID=A0A329QL87_9ACTN|nr:histidine phosphatase family protein [Actinobacteria bacterium YIM 96077]RAW13080.1 histidine phosphatase family protein [Phytoactinopolyspora halophila]
MSRENQELAITSAAGSTTTKVHLLRHGEVDNPRGVLYGRLPNYHLSERGQAMAERLAQVLADRDITVLVTSPLERAVETGAPIAKALDLQPDVDDELIEAANVFEGLPFGVGDGSLRRPRHWRYLRNPFRPSWGEPYVEIAARMRSAMDRARQAAAGHEALLVSHQLPIWTLRSAIEGRRLWHDPRKRECALASLTTFTYRDDAVVSLAYSEPAADLAPDAGQQTFPAGA